MSQSAKIKDVVITPVAFHDMPLLNSVGAHEPFALRSVVEVVTDSTYGLGESYGDSAHLSRLESESTHQLRLRRGLWLAWPVKFPPPI
jgi:glucarate dehydratase